MDKKPIGVVARKKKAIDKSSSSSKPFSDTFKVRKKSGILIIPYSDILYFKIVGRRVYLFRTDCNFAPIVFTGAIGKLEQQLDACGFARIHRSIIVNLTKINKITEKQVELFNHDVLPISRSYSAALKSKLI